MSDEHVYRFKVRDSDIQQQKSSAGHAAIQKKRHAHPGGSAEIDFVRKDVPTSSYIQQPQRPIKQPPYPETYHIWQAAHPTQQALVKLELPATCMMQNPLSNQQQTQHSPWNFQPQPQHQLHPELQYLSQPRVKIEPLAEPRYPLQPAHPHYSRQVKLVRAVDIYYFFIFAMLIQALYTLGFFSHRSPLTINSWKVLSRTYGLCLLSKHHPV